MAAQKKKNTIELNIQTKIMDKSQLENYKKTLTDMLKDTEKYGANTNTIRSTLSTINEILSSFPKDGKANLQQVTKLKNLFKDLGESTNKISTQLSFANTTKDVKELNRELENQRKILEEQQKLLAKQEKLKAKSKTLTAGEYAVKQDKKSSNRIADTKVDKLLKRSSEKNMSIKDYGTKNNFTEEEIKKAEQLQEKYSEEYKKYLIDQEKIIKDVNNEIGNITKAINEAQSKKEALEKQLKTAEAGGPSEEVVSAISTSETASINARETQQELEGLQEQMKKTGQATISLTGQNKELQTSFGKTAKAVFKYGFVYKTAMRIMKEAINTITQLDQALTDMSMLTGKSRQELHQLIPTLTDLAKETSSTVTEVAELTTEYMKQGRTLKDSLELSKQTAKAAKIAGINVSESLEYMTSAINGFNLAATDAERVSDIFAKVGAATATDYEQLAVALSKVSAQANTAGLSIEFTTSLLAKGIETTQEAPESIGTALKTILARMRELSDYGSSLEDNTSINKVERALGAVGVKLRDTNGQFRDMEEIFKELGPQWDTLTGMQQQAIAQAVAGTRQQSRFLAIMQDWDRTLEISSIAEESAGATRYQYAKQSEGLAATLTRLTTAWQSFVQKFADNDLIIKGAEILESVIDKVNNFLEFLNGENGKFASIATLVITFNIIKGLLSQMLEPISSALNAVQRTSEAVQQIANAQNGVNQELQQELTLREKIFEALDKSNRETEKSGKLEKSLFGIATKGLRNKIKESKKLTKQAKQELNYAGKLTKSEKKQVKEKKKQLASELKLEKTEKKKATSRKEIIKNAQQEYDVAKQKRLEAEKNLDTTNSNVAQAQKELQLSQEKYKNAMAEYVAADDIATLNERNLATSQAEGKLSVAAAEMEEKQKLLQEAQTQQQTAQVGLETAENNQKTKSIALSQAQESKERNIVIQKLQQFAFGVGTALTNFATMALAGIAIAAVTSMIGSIKGGVSGATARENIGENQEKIYENKEKKTNIQSLRDEYQELYLKKTAGTINQEEADRLDEIADALAEQDPSITGSNIVAAADAVINKLDEDNKKLIKSIEKDYNTVNKKRRKDDNAEWLKSDEGISAFQDLAQEKMKELNYTSESANAMLLQLTNSLDYDRIVDAETDMVELYKDVAEVAGSYAKDVDAAGGNLAKEIVAYNKAKGKITNSDLRDAFQQNNVTLEVLSNQVDTVNSLIKTGVDSESIKNYTDSLIALGFSTEGMADALGKLSIAAQKASGDMTAAYQDLLTQTLTWSEDDWAKHITGYADMDDAAKRAAKVRYQDQLKLFSTGMGLNQVSDKITNLSSVKGTSRDIASKLLAGEKLDLEDYDTLEELGLMSDDNFVKMLAETPEKAAMAILDNLDTSTADLEQKIKDTIESENITLEEEKKEFDELKNAILDEQGKFKVGVSQEDITRYNELNDSIALSKSLINSAEIKLKSLKEEVIAIDKYSAKIAINNKKISDTQKEMEDSATLEDYKEINRLLEENISLTKTKLENEWSRLADTVEMSADNLKDAFEYTEDGYKLNVENVEEWMKINDLTASEVNWLLENLGIVDETNGALEEQVDLQKENQQAMADAALEAQDYMLEMYKSKLEKENEALQESLDKRAEMYEKYFDSLEEKEEGADYETERQKLINRIASLSTATDSTSLAKLKEAQQELAELNKDRATSQRELRREAVAQRFEDQKAEAEKNLEATMADGNELSRDLIDGLKDGSLSLWGLGKDSGSLDGLTTLGMMNWFKEATGFATMFNSVDFTSMLTNIPSPNVTIDGVSNSSNNSSSIINNISLGEKLSDPVQKAAFEKEINDFFTNLLIQWGFNPNSNPY